MKPVRVNRDALILLAICPSIAIALLNGLYADHLARQGPIWYWLSDIAQFVLVPTLAFLALWRWGRFTRADFGLPREPLAKSVDGYAGYVLLVAILFFLSYLPVLMLLRTGFAPTEANSAFVQVLPAPGTMRIITVFYLCLSAAVVEELVFRSLPWLYFSRNFSRPVIPYCLTSAIFFGAVHWENGVPNLVASFSLGLTAAYLYSRIRNVQPFIWAHFLVDAWAFPWK